jgi:hypothetical protein
LLRSGRNHLTAAADFHAIWWRQASREYTRAVILPATQACDALRTRPFRDKSVDAA